MAERLREKQFGIEPTESAIIDPGAFDTSGIQLANALGELIGESAKFASVLASNAKSEAQRELQAAQRQEAKAEEAKNELEKEYDKVIEEFGIKGAIKLYKDKPELFTLDNMYSTMPDNWLETYGNEKKAKAVWQSYNEYLSTSVFYEGKRALLEYDTNFKKQVAAGEKSYGMVKDEETGKEINEYETGLKNVINPYFNKSVGHPSFLKNAIVPLTSEYETIVNNRTKETNDRIIKNIKTTATAEFNASITLESLDKSIAAIKNANIPEGDPLYDINEVPTPARAELRAKQIATEHNLLVDNQSVIQGDTKSNVSAIIPYVKDMHESVIPSIFRKEINENYTTGDRDREIDSYLDMLERLPEQLTSDNQKYGDVYPTLGAEIEKAFEAAEIEEEKFRAIEQKTINSVYLADTEILQGLLDTYNDNEQSLFKTENYQKFLNEKARIIRKYKQKKISHNATSNGEIDKDYIRTLDFIIQDISDYDIEEAVKQTNPGIYAEAIQLQAAGDTKVFEEFLLRNKNEFSIGDFKELYGNKSAVDEALKAISNTVRSTINRLQGYEPNPLQPAFSRDTPEAAKIMQLFTIAINTPQNWKDYEEFNNWTDVSQGNIMQNLFILDPNIKVHYQKLVDSITDMVVGN